jgi:RHS repeat-associated protein
VIGEIPGFDVPGNVGLSWNAPETMMGLTEKDQDGENNDRLRIWKRLVDMNGDGRPDLVVAASGWPSWKVYLNNGAHFADHDIDGAPELLFGNAATAGPLSEEVQSGGVRRTSRDVFDFNGDGLPDLVTGTTGGFTIYLNDGRLFNATAPITISIPGSEEGAVRAVKNNGETIADFVDLNGDGLPDRVLADNSGNWTVRINLGTTLSGAASWGSVGPIRKNSSKGNTVIDVLDWNNDGLVDWVNAQTGVLRLGKPTSGPGIRPYLMMAARNAIGGATYATYAPSSSFDNTLLPFVSWLVTETRRTDGLCAGAPSACLDSGNEIQRTYRYEEGYFDGPSREFRGFGKVTERYVWSSAANINSTPMRVLHFNQDDHTRGQIDMEETIATVFSLPSGSMTPVSRMTYTWDQQLDGSRTQIFLREKKTELFDVDAVGNEAPQCRLDRNEAPDEYGRVSTRCTLPCGGAPPEGCAGSTEGKVTTESDWADPPSLTSTDPAVRERPASVTVSWVKPGGGSETLSQQTFTYDWPMGNVLTATTTGDATTNGSALVQSGYDGTFGNMTSVEDARGGTATTSYAGTPFELFPSAETNAVGHTVETLWDLRHGKEIQVTGPNDEVTSATYDAAGRVTCEAKPGQTCGGTPAAQYAYVLGNPSSSTWEGKLSYVEIKTREPNNASGTLPGYLLSRTYVDALGRTRATASWRVVGAGNSLVWVVNQQVDYDGMGGQRKVYAPYQTGAAGTGLVGLAQAPAVPFTEYSYFHPGVIDPTWRVRSVTSPDWSVVTTTRHASWTHVFDQENNKTSTQTDFLGREKIRRLYEGTSTLKMEYGYTYDGLDRLLTTTVGGSTVTNTYDALGRKRQVADPDSGTWHTRFDLNGNAILQDDPKSGQRLEACHDAANRVVLQCSYPSDGTTAATYCPLEDTSLDAACGTGGAEIARLTYDEQPGDAECGGAGRIGQLTSVLDTSGGECWAYDERGRVTTQKKTILHNAVDTTARVQFDYDDADHLLWVRYPEQTTGHDDYTYQADGRPDTLEYFVAAADYDIFGRLIKLTSHRNTEDVWTYDTTGADNFRLQTIHTRQFSTNSVYLDLDYSYTLRGKVEGIADARDGGTALSNAVAYCYDGLGRLTRVDRDPTGGDPCASAADETFAHDSVGNLSAKNGASFGFAAGPHQPTSFGSVYASIGYDANGSRTLKDKGSGNKDELLYDARGNLVEVKRWTSGSVTSSQTNVYDHAGNRVVKAPSSGAGTTIRTYNRYAEVGGNNLSKHYYFGDRMIGTYIVAAPSHLQTGDEDPELIVPAPRIQIPPQVLLPLASGVLLLLVLPIGRRRFGVRISLARSASVSIIFLTATAPVVLVSGCGPSPTVRVYHTDHLGSTQVVTDWGGAIYRQMRYAAYGEIRGRFNAAGNPVGFAEDVRHEFTGYETDFAGLDYAGARFFDPELAQFASHDPAGQFASPYSYCGGDPTNVTDPTGAFVDIILFAIAAQVAASVDTYRATGDSTEAWQAGLNVALNQHTAGIYGAVKAQSNDDIGQYMASYALNLATGGVYGTARAFNEGQFASGLVGIASLAFATYKRTGAERASDTVSGTDVLRMKSANGDEEPSSPDVTDAGTVEVMIVRPKPNPGPLESIGFGRFGRIFDGLADVVAGSWLVVAGVIYGVTTGVFFPVTWALGRMAGQPDLGVRIWEQAPALIEFGARTWVAGWQRAAGGSPASPQYRDRRAGSG